MFATVTFSIRPGRVPEARALLRAAGEAPGQLDRRFVEIGVVNTILLFCALPDSESLTALGHWTEARRREAASTDLLRGLTLEAFAGDLTADQAAAPVLLLERGSGEGHCVLAGDMARDLKLTAAATLDAALHLAVARRQAGHACENALLIPETL